jgi:hypothetical protein
MCQSASRDVKDVERGRGSERGEEGLEPRKAVQKNSVAGASRCSSGAQKKRKTRFSAQNV